MIQRNSDNHKFLYLSHVKVRRLLNHPIVFDGRNILNKEFGKIMEKVLSYPEEIMPRGKFLVLPIEEVGKWRKIFTET